MTPSGICTILVALVVLVCPPGLATAQEGPLDSEQNEWFEGPVFEQLEFLVEELFSVPDGTRWVPVRVYIRNISENPRSLTISFEDDSDMASQVDWKLELKPGEEIQRVMPAYTEDAYGAINVTVWENGERISPRSQRMRVMVSRNTWGQNSRQTIEPSVLIVSSRGLPNQREFQNYYENSFYAQRGRGASYDCDYERVLPVALPLQQEAYLAIDRVLLIGIEPEDVTEAQRIALRRAVQSGLRVWIVPGNGGEGNGWLFGDGVPQPPAVEVQTDEGTRTLFRFADEAEDHGKLLDYMFLNDQRYETGFEYREGLGSWRRLTSATGYHFVESFETQWFRGFQYPYRANVDLYGNTQRGAWDWYNAFVAMFQRGVEIAYVFTLIAIYLLIIGPGLFLILRKYGRLIWLLWLQPLVVVGFLGLTFVVGYLNFGVTDRSDQIVFLFQEEGADWAHGVCVLTRYSAAGGRQSFSTVDGTIPMRFTRRGVDAPYRWQITSGDHRSQLMDVLFAQWSLEYFVSQGPVYLGGHVEVTDRGLESPEVTIENKLPFRIKNPFVDRRTHFYHAGVDNVVAPRKTFTMELLDRATAGAIRGNKAEYDLFRAVWRDTDRRTTAGKGVTPRAMVEIEDPSTLPAGIPAMFAGELASNRVFLITLQVED